MSDNIPIQKFNNLFISVLDEILGEVYVLTGVYTLLVTDAISLILHIISLKKGFDNRAKNERLLEMIQTLQTSNKNLGERIHTTENGNHKLRGKIDSMSMGYETIPNDTERLSERIHTVEIDNQIVKKL